MTIEQLSIVNLRNIKQAKILLSPGINLFLGENGAGKTTILEAVDLLSRGRTFRTRYSRALIQEGQERTTISAKLTHGHQITVEKSHEMTRVQINGAPVKSQKEVAPYLPTRMIHTESQQIVSSSSEHRKLMDWGVFHVKQSFYDTWIAYRRALQQRNHLLKQRASAQEINSWSHKMAVEAGKIDTVRKEYIEKLQKCVIQILEQKGAGGEIPPFSLRYKRGWNETDDLYDVLVAGLPTDLNLGYTCNGPHRAKLSLRWQQASAAERASRGQQKLIVAILLLAQIHLFEQQTKQKCILLIDDLAAEFDTEQAQWLLNEIRALEHQALVTLIEDSAQKYAASDRLFHVKQGCLDQE